MARLVNGDATVERIDDEAEDDDEGGVTSVGGTAEPFSFKAAAMMPLQKLCGRWGGGEEVRGEMRIWTAPDSKFALFVSRRCLLGSCSPQRYLHPSPDPNLDLYTSAVDLVFKAILANRISCSRL